MVGEDSRGGTREKILIAAASMLGEDPTDRLSVRSVAARAGVSVGSLRHFFPTQRELIDTVVAGMYTIPLDDGAFGDTTLPPADRLLVRLQQVLEYVGSGEQARTLWRTTHDAYIQTSPSDDAAVLYLALERAGRQRIQGWLTNLQEEGAIPVGDNERRARFLATVLSGISIERALPTDVPRPTLETSTLELAIAAVITDQ